MAADAAEGEGKVFARKPTVEEARACQFHCWFPKFGPKHAGKVVSLDLPHDFVEYLKEDGITVADDSRAFGEPASSSSGSESPSSTEEEESDGEASSAEDVLASRFGDLIAKVDSAIGDLEGSVMPKLNWACPKDATWMNPLSSLRCNNAEEIILMLKASDRVLHDVMHAFEDCADIDAGSESDLKQVLTLKKWYDFDRRRELRCFVVDGDLVGVSQRYLSEDAADLASEKEEILRKVKDFFRDVVKERFDGLSTYAFDIHISKRDRITIIDFNHSGESTNPLLYTWEELLHASGEAELRLCDSEDSRRTVPEKSVYGFPVDFNRLGDVLNSKDTDLFT